LDGIRDCWLSADTHLAAREAGAATARERTTWERRRGVNDQAYFVLMFAAFEDLVSRKFELSRVKHSQPHRSWRSRRAWEVLRRDVHFMAKSAILTEKGMADYNTIHHYREQRNKIAHGDFHSVGPIIIPSVYADLLAIARRLTV
jgi:hypothetical protein